MSDKKYLPRDVGSWRGLLDPYKPSDREGPRFGDNARPGSGFNLLAQGLAQGYSPAIGSYFNPSSFRSEGGASWLSQYAPRGVQKTGERNWEEAILARLNRAGMKTPGFELPQAIGPQANQQPASQPAPQPGGIPDNIQDLLRMILSAGVGMGNLGLGGG